MPERSETDARRPSPARGRPHLVRRVIFGAAVGALLVAVSWIARVLELGLISTVLASGFGAAILWAVLDRLFGSEGARARQARERE